jgi:predicted nuclease of predicted toxin-antitoxin system
VRFKLDENLDLRLAPLIEQAGHNVESVKAEGLSGCDDQTIYETCVREDRVLLTLDLDFSNPIRFPPRPTAGIVVLRPPRAVLPQIRATLVAAIPELATCELAGKLWIVEPGRLRLYDPRDRENKPR